MGQVFEEGHVLDLEADAPGAGVVQGHVVPGTVGAPAVVVIAHHGSEVALGFHGRQALGTVLRIVVITGAVPAEDAGGAPVHLVFNQGLGQEAFALEVSTLCKFVAQGIDAAYIVASHALDIAVVQVELDIQGIPQGKGCSDAAPEGVAIGLGQMQSVKAGRIVDSQHVGRSDITVVICGFKGVLADHAVHDPGGHADAVKGQRDRQGNQVNIVHVVLVVPAFCAGEVVIVGTAPEQGSAHVFVELVVQGHGSQGIGVQDRGAAGNVGKLNRLDAHADLEVRIRNSPVDVGIQDADASIVGTKGAAVFSLAPGCFEQLEQHCAGQVFGSNGFQLQTHTLGSCELVIGVALLFALAGNAGPVNEAGIANTKAHQPFAAGLEVNGLGRSSG